MALKFRLKGLAETFIDCITCPGCGFRGNDDSHFTTDHTRVTFDGIIVVLQCAGCGEIFVPTEQRLGIISPGELRSAVYKDSRDTGEPILENVGAVRLAVEKINANRKGDLH